MTDQGPPPPPGDDDPTLEQPGVPPPDADDTLIQPAAPGAPGVDPTRVQPAVPPPPPPTPPIPPTPPPDTPWWRRGWAILLWVLLGAALAFGLSRLLADETEPTTSTTSPSATSTTGPAATTSSSPASTSTSTPSTSTTTTPPTTTTTTTPPTTTTTAAPPEAAFSDGTHLVGTDVAPGLYETGVLEPLPPGGVPVCAWQRLSGTGGTPEEVIAEAGVDTHGIVEVVASDAALVTAGCGDWFELTPLPEPLTEVPPGTWAVEIHLAPGTYGAPGGPGCSWSRLSEFTGEPDAVIDGGTVDGSVIVDIAETDIGFSSTGCGSFAPLS